MTRIGPRRIGRLQLRNARRDLGVPIFLSLAVLGYGIFLSSASRAEFPDSLYTSSRVPFLSDKPVGEDGFYMLTVAWHLAEGQGIVYNHGKRTSGVQPLATLAYGGLAALTKSFGGDRWTFVRVVLVFGAASFVLFAWVMALIAEEIVSQRPPGRLDARQAGGITALIALSSFYVFRVFTYGLETGLYLLLIGTVLLVSLRAPIGEMRGAQVAGLGLLLGLTGLARIDFGVVVGLAFAIALIQRPRWRMKLAIAGSVALAVVVPWFLWVHSITGGWLPSSGAAQMADTFSWARSSAIVSAVLQQLAPWIFNGGRLLPEIVQAVTVLCLIGWVVATGSAKQLLPSGERGVGYIGILLATLFLIPIYLVFFAATHFYSRYLSPLLVFSLPAVGIASAKFIAGAPRWRLAASLALTCLFAVQAGFSLHWGRVGNTHAVAAGYVSANLSDRTVGAFQSGVIGFFNPNVVNLDGKIDDDALRARKADSMDHLLDVERVSAVIDWPDMVEGILTRRYAGFDQWTLCPGNVPRTHRCIVRPEKQKMSTRHDGRDLED